MNFFDFKKLTLLLLPIILLSCNVGKQNEVKYGDATLLLDGFLFTEGPTSDADGDIYFTDQPTNTIYFYSVTEGRLTQYTDEAKRANGLYYDQDGLLWACADQNNQLLYFDQSGKKQVVLNRAGNLTSFNGPNDLWIHENKTLYFTDPLYQRPYWEHPHDTLPHQSVYAYDVKKGDLIVFDSTLVQPNGIVGNSKENLLYVADIGADKVYKYQMENDGGFSNKEVFCEMGSDGMTLDSAGRLYLTGNGVSVFSEEGEKISHINIPEEWTANVTFGGADFSVLFVTAMDAVYKINTNTTGVK